MNKTKGSPLTAVLIILGIAVCVANIWGIFGGFEPKPEQIVPLTAEQSQQLTLELEQALCRSGSESVSGMAAAISFAVSPGEPAAIESEEVVQAINDVFSSNRAVGAAVAVITDGRVSWHSEYGYADRENGVETTVDTKFRVASLSKVVTAMNAMTLVDDGRMTLDGDIGDVFGYSVHSPYYPDVTISARMIMTHTAALADQSPNYTGSLRWNLVGRKRYAPYRPGRRQSYSNYGFGALGAAIECASGQKLYDYASSEFFTPMGIDASYEGSLLKDTSLIASCYFRSALERSAQEIAASFTEEPVGQTVHLGAGNLIISAVDYARMVTILINDGMYDGQRYLSEQSVAEMEKVHITAPAGYEQCIALRYMPSLINGHDMYYHTGNAYGVLSFACYDPVQRSGVVVVTSGSREETVDYVYEVCRDVAEICYEKIIDA